MEPLWSPGVATGGSQRQIDRTVKPRKQAKSVATGCHWLPATFMVRRGSTVRVRQRASEKCLQIGISCCLRLERADTFRTHFWYARRIATSGDALRHSPVGRGQAIHEPKALLRSICRCLSRRDRDHLPRERRSFSTHAEVPGPASPIGHRTWPDDPDSARWQSSGGHTARLQCFRQALWAVALKRRAIRGGCCNSGEE
jgi:hypothetical protein